MKRVYALILLLFMSAIPLKPAEAQELDHEFNSKNIYESELDTNTGELSLYAWNRETSIKFKLPISPLSSNIISKERVELSYGTYKVNIYELPSDEKHEYGGMEYEVFLETKPATNAFAFKINSQNLNFYYQPPLYEELNPLDYDFMNATHAIVGGEVYVYRPIDVVGSYAVYHSSKANNEYKTGKAFHIYRPKLRDSKGKEDWANMTIEKDSLRIDLPQLFLDSAEYPVIVDPGFGYDTIGGSTKEGPQDYIQGSYYSCPGSGTADNITFYLVSGTRDDGPRALGIYKKSDNSSVGVTAEYSGETPDSWVTHDLIGSPSLSAEDYYLVHWGEEYSMAYDLGTDEESYQILDYPGTWPDPWIPIGPYTKKWSIYCNYTTGPTGNDYVRDISQSIDWDGNASKGQWDLERTFSQSISLSSSFDREWSLSRALSQSLTFTLNAYGVITAFQEFVRTIILAVNWASDVSRRVDFHRSFSQTLTFTWNAYGPIFEVFRRTISLAINFTYDLPGLAVRTIRVWVRTLQNIDVEDALVTLSNPSVGTILWAHYTGPDGYTPLEDLDTGEYSLWVTKEDYQTYNLLFNFTDTTILETPLTHVEDAITLNFNIELLIFTGMACVLSLYGWHNKDLDGMLAATIAFFTWFASGLWFMWSYAGTEQVHFWYLFELFALVSLMLAIRNTLHLMDGAGKKGAWSEYG